MSELNATVAEINRLEGEQATLEVTAQKHEQAARECRAKKSEAKQRAAELRAVMNDAAVVNSVQTSMAAAESAKKAALASALEIQSTLAGLKAREAEMAENAKQVAETLVTLKQQEMKLAEMLAKAEAAAAVSPTAATP